MDKSKKSQILKLTLLAAILFITPLLSSSIRPTYLYFIINLLIIALGVEAGLLSSSSKPSEDKKPPAASFVTSQATLPDIENPTSENHEKAVANECTEKKFEKSVSEKIVVGGVKMRGNKVKKCPSMPSLFFIGGGGGENYEVEEFVEDDEYEEEGEEEVGHKNVNISGQEKDQLFNRAEMFIGNFYKQLKMQREDSWKRLHDIYHKAF